MLKISLCTKIFTGGDKMRVVSAETTLARYRSRASRGGTMFPHVPPPVSDGIAAAKIAQKRNRTAKPKRQKPRLIRLRAVGTKPSREERDYRVHCPCPAGVPGGAAPWRLLVTFRRRKVTPAPAGATLPIAWGKESCGCTAAKRKALRPAAPCTRGNKTYSSSKTPVYSW